MDPDSLRIACDVMMGAIIEAKIAYVMANVCHAFRFSIHAYASRQKPTVRINTLGETVEGRSYPHLGLIIASLSPTAPDDWIIPAQGLCAINQRYSRIRLALYDYVHRTPITITYIAKNYTTICAFMDVRTMEDSTVTWEIPRITFPCLCKRGYVCNICIKWLLQPSCRTVSTPYYTCNLLSDGSATTADIPDQLMQAICIHLADLAAITKRFGARAVI
jgi:hypothetical protein